MKETGKRYRNTNVVKPVFMLTTIGETGKI